MMEVVVGNNSPVEIRPLKRGDLEIIVAIDRAITGRARSAFFAKRMDHYARQPEAFVALAAEVGGKVAGFALARLYDGEFGAANHEAALDAIGVDIGARRRGIGRALIDGLVAAMRIRGVHEIATQVDWLEPDLLGFFAHAKFVPASRIVLECSVSPLHAD